MLVQRDGHRTEVNAAGADLWGRRVGEGRGGEGEGVSITTVATFTSCIQYYNVMGGKYNYVLLTPHWKVKLLVIHYCDDLYHTRTFGSVRTQNSSLEGAMKLKFALFCSSRDALSDGTIFVEVKISIFRPKTMDYNPWFDFGSPENVLRKVYHLKGNEKRNLMVLVSVA